jgi:hypothetical protein
MSDDGLHSPRVLSLQKLISKYYCKWSVKTPIAKRRMKEQTLKYPQIIRQKPEKIRNTKTCFNPLPPKATRVTLPQNEIATHSDSSLSPATRKVQTQTKANGKHDPFIRPS